MHDSVIEMLLAEPYRFSLFQAIYLVQKAHFECDPIGEFGKPGLEVIRLTNVDSLMFPASQIDAIEKTETDGEVRYRIETSLMGMYGILSPLPTWYTASLISPQEDGAAERRRLRDFLDIFNHRILSLASRVDAYRHLHRGKQGGPGDSFVNSVLALAGLGFRQMQADPEWWMFSSLSADRLLTQCTRSASNLKCWLEEHFPRIHITVEEFSPHWERIPDDERALLGKQNCRLAAFDGDSSEGAIIGQWMLDRETSFRVSIGPLNWKDFKSFLPSSDGFGKLTKLISLFTPDWLSFDLLVKLLGSECYHLQVCLDGKTSQLGFTAGLFPEQGFADDLFLVLDARYAA